MKTPKCFSLALGLVSTAILAIAGQGGPLKPLTVAEASQFKATSRYADVMAFIKELERRSPYIGVETLCTSAEGKSVPLIVLGNPLPAGPQTLRHEKRGIIYIQANIHAGEVEGKEASLMLARDIILAEKPPYFDRLIILIAPILNADGNDKISPANRPHQPGPEQGVGVRHNGQNLDLNRDSIKLESPEIRGVVANVLLRWDPLLLVDCHTTNGAYHQEVVTYSWALNPNGDSAIIAYQRDKMMPEIEANLENKYGTLAVGYGGFKDSKAPEKSWETVEPQPRYITNYIGLRNRLSILDENYVYADFKTRVTGNYNFLRAVLDYCHSHLDEVAGLVSEADKKTVLKGLKPSAQDVFSVEFEARPLKNPITVHAYEVEIIKEAKGQWPQVRPTDKVKIYTLPYFADYVGTRNVRFPHAYIIDTPDPDVLSKLRQHGLTVEKLKTAAALEVESFKLKEFKSLEKPYQGHHLDQVKGDYLKETREFPAGTYVVPTGQPLGNLAACLLEPESDDGLIVWNFFDRYLVPQWSRELGVYPVYKLLEPADLVTEAVK